MAEVTKNLLADHYYAVLFNFHFLHFLHLTREGPSTHNTTQEAGLGTVTTWGKWCWSRELPAPVDQVLAWSPVPQQPSTDTCASDRFATNLHRTCRDRRAPRLGLLLSSPSNKHQHTHHIHICSTYTTWGPATKAKHPAKCTLHTVPACYDDMSYVLQLSLHSTFTLNLRKNNKW